VYTVGRAAELTGIPRETLRKWESRYGVVHPSRTDGGYRLYDDGALRRLAAMRDLVDAGWTPREAAARVLAHPEPEGSDGEAPEGRGDLGMLTRAAEDMDPRLLDRALATGLPGDHLDDEVDGWLLPSLARLGLAWSNGRVTVAGEHFASAGVQRRLAQLFDAAPSPPAGAPHAVVGLARGSRHELGVLAFAAVLRHHGVRVTYVGGDLPVEAWLSTVRTLGPDAVIVGVPIAEDVPAVREVVSTLAAHAGDLFIGVGGAHQDRIADGTPLGHVVGEAAAQLAASLRAG
jgi:DNA-binding transcriptional MerR regulator/methanogenic corrinoid protein MtbC1